METIYDDCEKDFSQADHEPGMNFENPIFTIDQAESLEVDPEEVAPGGATQEDKPGDLVLESSTSRGSFGRNFRRQFLNVSSDDKNHEDDRIAKKNADDKLILNGNATVQHRDNNENIRTVRALRNRSRFRQLQGDKFLSSLRRKDVGVVQQMQADTDLRLYTYANQYGESAAESAVLSGSTEIVDCLLQNVPLKEKARVLQHCMLLAIRENDADILLHLICKYKEQRQIMRRVGLRTDSMVNSISGTLERTGTHPTEQTGTQETGGSPTTHQPQTSDNKFGTSKEQVKQVKRLHTQTTQSEQSLADYEDPAYSDHVTPLVLAAQLNRSDLIAMIIDKLTPDIHPLSQRCRSKTCVICCAGGASVKSGHRSIEDCRRSIEVLQALSSPAYLFIVCHQDPILEAFLISEESTKRKEEDAAFSATYEEVTQKCRNFGTQLLELCRTTEEVQTLLDCLAGLDVTNAKGHRARFPRLQLAIHYNQKEFVAHPHCQQLVIDAWIRGYPDWVTKGRWAILRYILYILILTAAFPVSFLVYMFPICPCLPVYKLERFIKEPAGKYVNDSVSYVVFLLLLLLSAFYRDDEIYELPPCPLEWCIIIWVCGLTARFAKITYYRRNSAFRTFNLSDTHTNWQIDDFLTLLCFWLWFILRLVSVATSSDGIEATRNESRELSELTEESNATSRASRLMWSNQDPFLISEVFYAGGCILAVMHVFTLLKPHPKLGPLQMSLKAMTSAFLRFLVLFSIVMAAFTLGLSYLYSGYTQVMADGVLVNEYMTSISMTLKTLFWSLFGYGDPDQADLLLDNQRSNHRITELTGYSFFGLYHVITVIFLANMLIAMVTNFYNDIETNADEEWKYTMTQLRMSYFNEIGCLPPPFNLCPSRRIIKWIRRKLGSGERNLYHTHRFNSQKGSYEDLLERLQQRYWQMRNNAKIAPRATGRCSKSKHGSVLHGEQLLRKLGISRESSA